MLAQRPWVRLDVAPEGVVGSVGVTGTTGGTGGGVTVVASEPPPPQALRVRVKAVTKAVNRLVRLNKVLACMGACV